jgi:hypothetical protein
MARTPPTRRLSCPQNFVSEGSGIIPLKDWDEGGALREICAIRAAKQLRQKHWLTIIPH